MICNVLFAIHSNVDAPKDRSANLIQCVVVYASRMVVYTLLIIIIGDKLKFIFDKLPIVRRQNNRTFSDFLTFPTINYCVRNDAVTRIIRDIWPTLRVYRIISIWRSKKMHTLDWRWLHRESKKWDNQQLFIIIKRRKKKWREMLWFELDCAIWRNQTTATYHLKEYANKDNVNNNKRAHLE